MSLFPNTTSLAWQEEVTNSTSASTSSRISGNSQWETGRSLKCFNFRKRKDLIFGIGGAIAFAAIGSAGFLSFHANDTRPDSKLLGNKDPNVSPGEVKQSLKILPLHNSTNSNSSFTDSGFYSAEVDDVCAPYYGQTNPIGHPDEIVHPELVILKKQNSWGEMAHNLFMIGKPMAIGKVIVNVFLFVFIGGALIFGLFGGGCHHQETSSQIVDASHKGSDPGSNVHEDIHNSSFFKILRGCCHNHKVFWEICCSIHALCSLTNCLLCSTENIFGDNRSSCTNCTCSCTNSRETCSCTNCLQAFALPCTPCLLYNEWSKCSVCGPVLLLGCLPFCVVLNCGYTGSVVGRWIRLCINSCCQSEEVSGGK